MILSLSKLFAGIPVAGMLLVSTAVHAQRKFDVEGHRGCRGLMPENSIPAMLHAVELGVRTLELDCVISADGLVVVSHDPWMNPDIMRKPDGSRIDKGTEKNYAIYRMPYDSIRKYTLGGMPYAKFPEQAMVNTYKPLLSELIDSVENYVRVHHLKPVYYNMETKSAPEGDKVYHPEPEPFVSLLMGVIKSRGIAERVTIQSFDPRTLQIVHRDYPRQVTALLVENQDGYDANINRLGFVPSIYSPYYLLVNPELIQKAHAQGVAVLPWTVNEEKEMTRMKELGVDGLISDYPDRLVKLFGTYQGK